MRKFAWFLFASFAWGQSTCLRFPSGLIPLSSIAYVTAANSAGDRLVVGSLANGLNTLAQIPTPDATNQLFCDASVQLTAGQFFPSVYVPTAAERSGNFSAFAGLIVNPTGTNIPYPGGIIPPGQLGSVYAFRIGPVDVIPSSRGWALSGSMSVGRLQHASVLLPSGKVLVVGPGTTAEIYDPRTGTFALTGSTQFSHGDLLTATLLNDGRVLVVGGVTTPISAELYDPVTGKFSKTGQPLMAHGYWGAATLLTDGRVLVVGGLLALSATVSPSSGAEIYDPKTEKFSAAAPMAVNRSAHTMTLLNDNRVLIAGGFSRFGQSPGTPNPKESSAEIFDPVKGTFSSLSMNQARATHFAALLPDGKVLISGGVNNTSLSAELFDPKTDSFVFTGSMNTARSFSTASILPNGQVLIAGGEPNFPASTPSTELYNPATGVFSTTANLGAARSRQTATTLLDGRVLAIGGDQLCCALSYASTELYTPTTQGLVTSQTGLTFRGAQGAGALASQNIFVLSPTDTIPFTVATSTFTGGSWLKAAPISGTAVPTSAPVALTITADATGLAATDYYGSVTLTPTDGKHPPVSIAIVLTIVPAGAAAAPGVTPTGLLFTGTAGSSPAARTFVVSNVTSKVLTFTGVATQATSFFDFAPKTGSINAGQSQSITVTPSSGTLAAGVYRGSIKLTFGDGTAQTLDVLLVASPAAGASAQRAATTCTPIKLLPQLQSIASGSLAPVGWPTSVIVQVVDDCGGAINTGAVTASFTNGDSSIPLLAIGGGIWSATWTPVRDSAGAGVRVDAQSAQLTGTMQVSVKVATNPNVPVVAPGGVLSSGDYLGAPAQGLLASIFGVALAEGTLGNTSLPLPKTLGSTNVVISGVVLPALFVSEGQVNVFIPYELAVNAPHQLYVRRGNAASVPVPITIFENQPAILATAGNGAGQGHIYRINSGAQLLADVSAPAKAGDVLVIYCVGLGPVNPPLKSGDPAPLTSLEPITGIAAVTIGGIPAKVDFAGLTPAYSGLYQVNIIVPAGITPGNQVPVTVSVNGRAGAGQVFAAFQ
jgi:uncharacterized protein (TIGR03437 family)